MDVLKGLDSVSLAKTAMQELAFLWSILHVLLEQNRSDYTAIALPVLIPSLRILATEHQTNKTVAFVLRRALVIALKDRGMKEKLIILDLILPLAALHLPKEHAVYLMLRAECYIDHHEGRGEPDCDSVVAAISDVQTHLLQYGKPKGAHVQRLFCEFFHRACDFVIHAAGLPEARLSAVQAHQSKSRIVNILSILAVAYGVEEDESDRKLSIATSLTQFLGLLLEFRYYRTPFRQSGLVQSIKEFIQALYAEHVVLEDGDTEFLKELILHQIQSTHAIRAEPGELPLLDRLHGTSCSKYFTSDLAPRPRIRAAIEYSLSMEPPRDELALMRVMVAAPAARLYDLPITMRAYQLLMSADDMWAPITVPLHIRQTTYRFTTFMVRDAISYALALGYPDLALEWADQSSSVVWSQVLHLHLPFTQVAAVDAKVAEELADAASQILDLQVRRDFVYPDCASRWEDAIRKARKLPGLDRFLRHKTSSEIRSAVGALGGPVVYFNINRYSCDALCGLDSVSLAEAAMQELAFLWSILRVLLEQNRSDYTAIALPVLIPSLRILATEHQTNKTVAFVLRRALVIAVKADPDMNETLIILDLILPLSALHLPEEHAVYLIVRAEHYINHNEGRGQGEADYDSVVAAIGDVQTHLLRYGKPKGVDVQSLFSTFVHKARKFLIYMPRLFGGRWSVVQMGSRMVNILSILAVAYGVEEAESVRKLSIATSLVQFLELLLEFRYYCTPVRKSSLVQGIKEFIQAIYAERVVLEDSDTEFLKELILHQIQSTHTIDPEPAANTRCYRVFVINGAAP
ncbi:hypothetical protein BDN72DRAFT_906178 [Pluteus cervinus]|uniref:Uncharacterized protein n=1 Tax=Pluteus cervinus TaxID=181527 RepID=A0ACD3A104_9AGAR|nr:hypothetical protein BDN72DRAFT_906178 [Pluteus cervinus]